MSQREETEKYIRGHIGRVNKWMRNFAEALYDRGRRHDASKLREPEISGWTKMDLEPRYPYGSPEYLEKKARFAWLFEEHYSHNRHHPEYFDQPNVGRDEVDMIDLIEMLCDWCGYRDNIRYSEASRLVKQQCQRYGFSEEMSNLIFNTFINYFSSVGNIGPTLAEPNGKLKTEDALIYDKKGNLHTDKDEHKLDLMV